MLVSRDSAPRRALSAVAGGFGFLSLSLLAPLMAHAAAPTFPDIMPLRQVHAGMEGYGLTTFKGNTISRFHVRVIGILKKENAGHDLILIRMSGGPITERGANLIHGMSGSPIYIDGKIIGAFSQGEQFPKEPVGMVTPIEDMLESWDPNIPQTPPYFQPADKQPPTPAPSLGKAGKVSANTRPDTVERVAVLPHPIIVGSRHISRLVLNAPPDDPRRSTGDVAVMHRATTLLTIPGISDRVREWLQQDLNKRGLAVTIAPAGYGGGGRAPGFRGPSLRPGSIFGAFLVTGDIPVGGWGTVTYRRGEKILAYGHPGFGETGMGPMEAAITSAYVVDVFAGLRDSHLIPVNGEVVGSLRQDRNFAVSAEIGQMPHLVPFDVTVHDQTTQRTEHIHCDIFQHPDYTGALMTAIAREAITRAHYTPGDVMAHITTTLDAAEVGRVTRSNIAFDSNDIASVATQDLSDITGIVSGNPFYPLPIHSAKMTVEISRGHETATVERIFLKQGRYEPGDTLEIGVVLKPYRRDPITRTISLKIPSDTPTGRYQLVVRGGMANIIRLGGFILSSGSQDPQTPPVNVRQMVARLNEHETNTDMVARLILNSIAPALEGEKLSQLPPNLAALMRSDRNSGVRLEREELRTTQPTDYVVSGSQQLLVTIVRKNTQEPAGSGGFGSPSSPGGVGGPSSITIPGGGLTGVSVSDDGQPAPGIDADGTAGDNQAQRSAPLQLNPETLRWMSMLSAPPPPASATGDKQKADAPPKGNTDKASADAKGNTAPPAAPTTQPTTRPAASTTPDTTNDKPVGRQVLTWKQTAKTDFAAGKFSGTSVTAAGDLRLTPTLHRLVSSTETYIWSLAPDAQGNLYAGTGTSGKILKITPQGTSTVFAQLPAISIQCLLLASDGTLWAGTGVKGMLYRIAPDGSFRSVHAFKEKYIMTMAEDSKGNLYLGPGGAGTVYKLPKNSDTPTEFLRTSADHILALTTDSHDNLYVGTGNDGILYKVTPDGKSSVLYDAKENSITALAVMPNGDLYAATGPKGILYRIASDGTATVVFDRASAFYTGLKAAPDGTLYASTVNAIYHILPSTVDPALTVVRPLDNPKDVDFLTLAVLPDGQVVAGTGNIGEIYTATPTPQANAANGMNTGTFVSVVHDAKLSSRWGNLRWEATLPAHTSLTVETRTGSVAEPDATWSDWSPVRKIAGSAEGAITSPSARFIQYRLTLQAPAGVHPTVREVALDYMTRNQAPRVAFVAPAGGERWSKTQTLRWSGVDPDGDTLTYDLYYSIDGGVTWKPFPLAGKPASGAAGETTGTGASSSNSLEELQKDLDSRPGMPDELKRQILESARRRSGSSGGSLRETSKSWDTTTLPDGTYWLKVVASDRVSNPTDALTAQAISEPFLIANAPPKISIGGKLIVGPDKSVTVEGSVLQSLVAVTAVQYRIDGGDWTAAVSKDGLFDAPQEHYIFLTPPLAPGKHTIEVEAFNAAGNKAVEKIDVTVP